MPKFNLLHHVEKVEHEPSLFVFPSVSPACDTVPGKWLAANKYLSDEPTNGNEITSDFRKLYLWLILPFFGKIETILAK